MSNERSRGFLGKHWLLLFILIFGLYAGLPFMAPVFMQAGWNGAGLGIYRIYSFLCHQLPQRSFFLFGPQGSYSLAELRSFGVDTADLLSLRQFTGSPELGWKVAWSDRMVSMYTGILLCGIVWRPLKRSIPKLPLWGLALLLLPMALDGSSHLISDLAGLGRGFRDGNVWLAALTGYAFSPGFYVGDALGSFNSWMRLITGLLFGLGVVWYSFPYLEAMSPSPTPARQAGASEEAAGGGGAR